MTKIIDVFESLFDLNKNISHKIVNVKKILACTNLSKLNNSSQLDVGIYCPGVQHSPKMISVHKMAAVKLCFKSSLNINRFLLIKQILVYYCKQKNLLKKQKVFVIIFQSCLECLSSRLSSFKIQEFTLVNDWIFK